MYTGLERYERYAPLFLRIGIGLTMFLSGLGKATGLEGVTRFFTGIGIPIPGLMAPLVAYTELIGGALLILGLGTRIIGLLFAIIMLVATFSAKWAGATKTGGVDFNQIRLEFLILMGSLALMFSGSGALSIDKARSHRPRARS